MSNKEGIDWHLAKWGLRDFSSEDEYYTWQRQSLPPHLLSRLHELAEQRQGGMDAEADRAFYDLASSTNLLPVLYSQRFGYLKTVGVGIAQLLESGQSILDVGCGVGILTTWYASRLPASVFVGVDRSPHSIEVARKWAAEFRLNNISFQACTVPSESISQQFDVIVATHALFQSESEPGLPSSSWRSFERAHDPPLQQVLEARTGVGERLDWVVARLRPHGRLLVFEKTLHLGRRALFQRALAARGFACDREPAFLCYSTLGDPTVDGPLYSLTFRPSSIGFRETPFFGLEDGVYRCQGQDAEMVWEKFSLWGMKTDPIHVSVEGKEVQWQMCRSPLGFLVVHLRVSRQFTGVLVGMRRDEDLLMDLIHSVLGLHGSDQTLDATLQKIWPLGESTNPCMTPLYENHTPRAQEIWENLPHRVVRRETTREDSQGRQFHAELGSCGQNWAYLYWANTFDQRQLVIMENKRKQILDAYFEESGCGAD